MGAPCYYLIASKCITNCHQGEKSDVAFRVLFSYFSVKYLQNGNEMFSFKRCHFTGPFCMRNTRQPIYNTISFLQCRYFQSFVHLFSLLFMHLIYTLFGHVTFSLVAFTASNPDQLENKYRSQISQLQWQWYNRYRFWLV